MSRPPTDDAPFSALAFKVMSDPFVGSLTFIRIYSGVYCLCVHSCVYVCACVCRKLSHKQSYNLHTLTGKIEAGTSALNPLRGKKERIGRLLMMHANNREDVKAAYCGDIVAVAGLKDVTTGACICVHACVLLRALPSACVQECVCVPMESPEPVINTQFSHNYSHYSLNKSHTGDTLCDFEEPIVLERMEFPEPVIKIAIEPKSKADSEKMGMALAKLAQVSSGFLSIYLSICDHT